MCESLGVLFLACCIVLWNYGRSNTLQTSLILFLHWSCKWLKTVLHSLFFVMILNVALPLPSPLRFIGLIVRSSYPILWIYLWYLPYCSTVELEFRFFGKYHIHPSKGFSIFKWIIWRRIDSNKSLQSWSKFERGFPYPNLAVPCTLEAHVNSGTATLMLCVFGVLN